jgi:hypothetical protein
MANAIARGYTRSGEVSMIIMRVSILLLCLVAPGCLTGRSGMQGHDITTSRVSGSYRTDARRDLASRLDGQWVDEVDVRQARPLGELLRSVVLLGDGPEWHDPSVPHPPFVFLGGAGELLVPPLVLGDMTLREALDELTSATATRWGVQGGRIIVRPL